MSFENNLKRIADALEMIAEGTVNGAVPADAVVKEKKATKKTKKKADEEPGDFANPFERADVQKALVSFVKDGPGKGPAVEIFEEFKAGSISTLQSSDYGAFIARLEEVAAVKA